MIRSIFDNLPLYILSCPTTILHNHLLHCALVDTLVLNTDRVWLCLRLNLRLRLPVHLGLVLVCKLVVNAVVKVEIVKLFVFTVDLTHFFGEFHS